MANEEHLAVLLQGVDTWNHWRRKNLTIEPDLSGADLKNVDLSEANLHEANFSSANLSEACLFNAELRYANFIYANLSRSDLGRSSLMRSNLREANLYEANLSEANLSEAYLFSANLSRADLSDAYLSEANFSHANLHEANLCEANLCEADFHSADLSNTRLKMVQALATNFTSATLTGACLRDWHINQATKLNSVKCDYVYLHENWDSEFTNRRPSSGKFAPGEFTLLFQKALDTVDLIFADGIDWKAFFQSFQELRSQYGDDNLSIQAIEKKSGGSFVIRLEVAPELDKAAIHSHAEELYEKDLRLLEERVVEYKDEVSFLRQSNTNLERIVGTMSDNQPTHQTIIQNPGHIAALNTGSGTISHVTQNIGQNLSEITKLITTLREAAHTFPAEQREEALGHLDDLQEDLSKPERQEPSRIKRRLKALVAIALTLGTMAAGTVDFANNLTDLAEKLGVPIELSQSQTSQQLPLLEQPNLHVLLSQSPLSRLSLEPASLQSLVRDVEL